jgi:HEAT repeat protein
MAAAAALGKVGGDHALEPLLLALKDSDPGVQIAALKGLSDLGDPSALSGVQEHVAASRGAVLIAGLKALALLGEKQALEPLLQALADRDEEVVEAAIEILSRFGGAWVEQWRDRLLHHPHWGVRSSFVRVLGEALGTQALPFLKEAREEESDPLVKGEIEGVMGRLA